jgi:DNA-binding NarL/FixJ family response regulator
VIRVFVVDDHPAVRAGISTMLNAEPGLEFAGAAQDARQALQSIGTVRPDVALIDYKLPAENGLVLCHRVKQLPHAPGVLIYTGLHHSSLGVAAAVAGANGVLTKTAAPDELLDAIRLVARGRIIMPAATAERVRASAAKLDPDDVPIFGMLMQHTPGTEIAATLKIDGEHLSSRVGRMLGRLVVDTTAPRSRV